MGYDRPTPTRPILSAATVETKGNGNHDPREESPGAPHETKDQYIERAILETHGMIHNVAVAVENVKVDQRVLRTDVELIRLEQQRIGKHLSILPPKPATLPPPRREMPSGHFDDYSPDEKTDGGTRLIVTREQLDARTREQFERWVKEHEETTALNKDAALVRDVRGRVKAGVWTLMIAAITGGLAAAWTSIKAYVASHH